MLKPGLTFTNESSTSKDETTHEESMPTKEAKTSQQSDAQGGLDALEGALPTPVRLKYKERVNEGYDITLMKAVQASKCTIILYIKLS